METNIKKCYKCGKELTKCSLQNGDYFNGYCKDCKLYYSINYLDDEVFEELEGEV